MCAIARYELLWLLKDRWRCLDSSGGNILYKPEKVCDIVRACAVLYNVAQLRNVALPSVGCVGPDPDPYPQAFEPNAACGFVDLMHRLTASEDTALEGCDARG
ncbi:putative nuclease HARBI1 [Oncorhynchus keta]|uniref:putative nuclease HARBI1 n=1 Tax=Oncorhynchus keta TaxID=8018 RepID=UPI00227B3D56|nr:putative nuclease HARBI1 [Oncorhynchus keta]